MAENTDVPENADENPGVSPDANIDEAEATGVIPETPPAPEPVVPAAPAGPRLRDRAFSFRSVVAVAAATLLLGGAGGAGLVAATSDNHDGKPRIGRFADGPGGRGDNQRGPGGYGGQGQRFDQNGPGTQQQQNQNPEQNPQQNPGQAPPAAPGGTS